MAEWFGHDEVASWQLLRVYRIPFAQPNQVTRLKLMCNRGYFWLILWPSLHAR